MTDAATAECPTCHGTGMDYDDSLGICPGCGGSGEDEAETSAQPCAAPMHAKEGT